MADKASLSTSLSDVSQCCLFLPKASIAAARQCLQTMSRCPFTHTDKRKPVTPSKSTSPSAPKPSIIRERRIITFHCHQLSRGGGRNSTSPEVLVMIQSTGQWLWQKRRQKTRLVGWSYSTRSLASFLPHTSSAPLLPKVSGTHHAIRAPNEAASPANMK